MTLLRSDVFCDWLDVTCHPEHSFIDEVVLFLNYHLFPVLFSDGKGCTKYRVGNGVLSLECKRGFHRASVSGGVIRELEGKGLFRDYVNVLGSVGHNVTRIDAAVDVYRDAPSVLRGLECRYPDDLFSFGRKSLRVMRVYSARDPDRALTGTWYVGHRSKARVTARVYDKQFEALEKRGEILPPTTRYELTFKKDYHCSLYDALMPESLFYTHASPKLLSAPEGKYILPWAVKGIVPWKSEPFNHELSLERFEQRVCTSPEMLKLAELASEFGSGGEAIILRHFQRCLTACLADAELAKEDVTTG